MHPSTPPGRLVIPGQKVPQTHLSAGSPGGKRRIRNPEDPTLESCPRWRPRNTRLAHQAPQYASSFADVSDYYSRVVIRPAWSHREEGETDVSELRLQNGQDDR
jgi:hypothetical protein